LDQCPPVSGFHTLKKLGSNVGHPSSCQLVMERQHVSSRALPAAVPEHNLSEKHAATHQPLVLQDVSRTYLEKEMWIVL